MSKERERERKKHNGIWECGENGSRNIHTVLLFRANFKSFPKLETFFSPGSSLLLIPRYDADYASCITSTAVSFYFLVSFLPSSEENNASVGWVEGKKL